ncbi:hypothetical protein MTR67_042701 [Solanum verrucosum]|uniref:Tf2-1-like SH3-like domain-containing protein n=1 Tax=Solanum verrucosum TaxID=315347 RepID=A0AAF0UQH8_SOLVR|nr:hypothetical protein MTR67_042701 [Solanum verrucosum]
MKGVMRFCKKGKLSPRYVGLYKILKKIGRVAYELELPTELATVHPVFHISLLKKCMGDPTSIVPLESMAVKDSLTYEEVPVEILDCQVQRLRNKDVASVKVLWRSQSVDGATWEAEAAMKAKYTHVFPFDSIPTLGNSSSSVFQSFMRKFSLSIMFLQFVIAFSAYLHVLGT